MSLKDETLKLVCEWSQKYESMKQDFEQLLIKKDEELKTKDELIEQRSAALNAKIEEIENLSMKTRDLEELAETKSSEVTKNTYLHSKFALLIFAICKTSLSEMRRKTKMISFAKQFFWFLN